MWIILFNLKKNVNKSKYFHFIQKSNYNQNAQEWSD